MEESKMGVKISCNKTKSGRNPYHTYPSSYWTWKIESRERIILVFEIMNSVINYIFHKWIAKFTFYIVYKIIDETDHEKNSKEIALNFIYW